MCVRNGDAIAQVSKEERGIGRGDHTMEAIGDQHQGVKEWGRVCEYLLGVDVFGR